MGGWVGRLLPHLASMWDTLGRTSTSTSCPILESLGSPGNICAETVTDFLVQDWHVGLWRRQKVRERHGACQLSLFWASARGSLGGAPPLWSGFPTHPPPALSFSALVHTAGRVTRAGFSGVDQCRCSELWGHHQESLLNSSSGLCFVSECFSIPTIYLCTY